MYILDMNHWNWDFNSLDKYKYDNVLIQHSKHKCCKCGAQSLNDNICNCKSLVLVKHHISYFPEIMIKICSDCHYDIHHSKWGAPTNSDGTLDFNKYQKGKDYTSENRDWIKYKPEDRDTFYYTKDDYEMMRGFGHSYPEQILDLASEANVKQVIVTHHDLVNDQELQLRFENATKYASSLKNHVQLKFANEGDEIIIQ